MGKVPDSTKHNIMPVKKGDQLTAGHYNAMVEFGRDELRKSTVPLEPIKGWTPYVHNKSGITLPMFSISVLDKPKFTEASGYPIQGYSGANYIDVVKPTGEPSDVVAINEYEMPNNAANRVAVTGITYCQVLYKSDTLNCNYATTVKDDVTCLKASDSGQCKIIWSAKREAGKQWSLVLLNTGAGGGGDRKIIGLCEDNYETLSNGLVQWKFSESTIRGGRVSYDENAMISAYIAPYIEAITPGGLYTLEWFDTYNGWVVIAGTCSRDTRDYTPYTTSTIKMHSTGSSSQNKVSGTVRSIGQHDEFATLEYNRITTHDAVGYPGRSSNMFAIEPTFALNSEHNEIIFKDAKLNPGAYGIDVFQFVITDCNGSNKDVYTVAFRCIEENTAPSITVLTKKVELHLEQEKTTNICRVTNTEGDPISIYNKQYIGDTNLVPDYDLWYDSNSKIVALRAKAGKLKVGTAHIEFYIDDGHDLQCTHGTYEKVEVALVVTNRRPEVVITNSPVHINRGETKTVEIGTITDPEGDNGFVFNSFQYTGAVNSCSMTVDNGKLYATLQASDYSAGDASVSFKAHDKYGIYSDGLVDINSFDVVVENPAPEVNLTMPTIRARVSGGLEQDFVIGRVTNKSNEPLYFTYLGASGLNVLSGYDIIDNQIYLYLDIPQDGTTGTATIRFKIDDSVGAYTTQNPTITVQVLVSDD